MMMFRDIEKKAVNAVKYGERLKPMRDWFFLLMIALFLVILSAVSNVWVFLRVERGESVGTPPESATQTESAIDQAEAVFEARRLEEARYKGEYQFVDPS